MTWRTVPIRTVIHSSQYGLSLPANPLGTMPIVGMKDVRDGRVHIDPGVRVSLTEREAKPYLLNDGDILLNRTNSPDLVGKAGIYRGTGTAVFASYLVRLVLDQQQVDPDFVIQVLGSEGGQRRIRQLATRAVSQANLNPSTFKSHFRFPLPALREQICIRSTLLTWDTAIQKTSELIAAKERHYRYQLSRVISRGRHAPVQIGSFAEEVSARNRGRNMARILSVTNARGFVLPEDQFERRVASADLSNYKAVCRGQYAYNPSRINVGSIARLDGWDDGVLSPMYVVFRLDEVKINSDYFLHWLNSHEARQRIKNSAQGSVRASVSFRDLAAITTPLADGARQVNIARYLNSLRTELDLLGQSVAALKTQKRGLTQKLLTGQWSCKVDCSEASTQAKEIARG